MSARLIKNGQPQSYSAYVPFIVGDGEVPAGTAFSGASIFPPSSQFQAHKLAGPAPGFAKTTDISTEEADATSAAEAEQLLEHARQQAQSLIAQARGQAAEVEREARERGLAAARASVAAEVAELAEPLRDQLTSTLEELAEVRGVITARAERDLVRLAIEIARKIVHREVTVDGEIALTLARVALSRLHNRAAAIIHLHPDDFAYVNAHRHRIEAANAIELVEDRGVGRGGCLVETEMGDVDARIEQQFAEIERSFLGA